MSWRPVPVTAATPNLSYGRWEMVEPAADGRSHGR